MNILLAPAGSSGDVNPFVGLGRGLAARGHRVTMLGNGHDATLFQRVGLDFVEVSSGADFMETIADPRVVDPRHGLRMILALLIVRPMRPLYAAIEARFEPGRTLVLASGMGFGARIAQERLGVPLVTVHLQPSVFTSLAAMPSYGIPWLGAMPAPVKRSFYRLFHAMLDRVVAAPTNRFREELGLAPVRRVMRDWWHSPDGVIGLWPGWFGPPQPDWPPRVRVTDFPLYDAGDAWPMPEDLVRFIERHRAPIVFTPGSAMFHAGRFRFFETAIEICRRLARPGVLLTPAADQVPDPLPDGVCRFDYAPFGALLPRAAAIVHHGGIGTTAEAMRAGIPQLLTPYAFDQPDNAARLRRLGVARSMPLFRFRPRRAAHALRSLLDDEGIRRRCQETKERLHAAGGLARTCALVEAHGAAAGL